MKGIDFLLLYGVTCGLLINIIIFVGLKIERSDYACCIGPENVFTERG